MKKILFMLLAFVGFVSSCENDDIEVTSFGDLTYTVSTQSVYDDFGISNQFKGDFLSKGFNIGVWTFMYGKDGNLAASDSVFTKTFGRIEQNFTKIPSGEYTVITVEMLVEEDLNNKSESFLLIGEDKLSTLQIALRSYYTDWYSAVGVSTETITVNNGDSKTVNVTPKGIGAYMDWVGWNFDKSDYRYVAFFTKEHLKGRFLSPYYTGEERFEYKEYLESNEWAPRDYEYKKNGLADRFTGSAYLLEEGNVKCCFGAQEIDENGDLKGGFYCFPDASTTIQMRDGQTYRGGFSYIGGVNPMTNCAAGMFTSTSELNNWYNNLNLNFNAPDAEPYLKWGASANDVTKYMQNCKMKFTYDGTNEDMYYSGWSNPDETLKYEYRFDTSKNNLNSLLMLYSSDAYSMENVFSDLKTKYVNEGYDSELGGYYFHTKNNETELLLFENEGGFGVLYVGSATSNAPKCVVSNTTAKSMLKLKSTMKK